MYGVLADGLLTYSERHLHEQLDDVPGEVPVATAARDNQAADAGAAEATWLLHGDIDAPPRLIDLADVGAPAPYGPLAARASPT